MRTVERAKPAPDAMALTFSPKSARSLKTSLIRRISDLGLGIVAPSQKGATILLMTSVSAADPRAVGGGENVGQRWRNQSAKGGDYDRPEVAVIIGQRWRLRSAYALGASYASFLEAYSHRPGVPAADAARDLREDVDSIQESNFLADMHAANGAATYAYYFDQVPVDNRPKGLGAEHGGELEYLFGNQPAEHRWDDVDRQTSKLMGDYWVRFAKTGDPNGSAAPVWSAVKGKPTDHLVMGARTSTVPSTPLEEHVKAATLATVEKLWAAQEAP